MADTVEQKEGELVLVYHSETYWLLHGMEHLDALLLGDGDHPRPVRCLKFESSYDMSVYLSGVSAQLGDLWSVHPAVVQQLRANNELIELSPPPPGG